MERIKRFSGVLIFLICCTSFSLPLVRASVDIPIIGTVELKHKLDQGEPMVLANALSSIEFRNLTIKGSINIPSSKVSLDNPLMPKDKNQLLVFFCKGPVCVKSHRAARKAINLGYTNVKVYQAGLPDWIKKRFPVSRIENYPDVQIPFIAPQDVVKQLKKLILLDIRGKESKLIGALQHGHIFDIPLDDLEKEYQILPKDKMIIIIDLAGKQGEICGRFLTQKGYSKMAVMDGGALAWLKMVRRLGEQEILRLSNNESE